MVKVSVDDVLKEYTSSTYTRGEKNFLNTGDYLFNLACSDDVSGGYPLGRFVSLRGLSHAGKTLLALTALSEAAVNPFFDDYKLILNDTEAAYQFDTVEMFGQSLADRIHIVSMKSAEEIYVFLKQMLEQGIKFIFVNDSFDSVTTAQDKENYKNIEKAVEKDKLEDAHKSYNMLKAKFSNDMFKNIAQGLENTESLLINVSQTKEDIQKMGYGDKRRVSGGKGLDYYSSITVWCKQIGKNDVEVEGDKYTTWTISEVDITKNRVTGKRRKANIILDYNYGVDHIRSAIHYLIKHDIIAKSGRNLVWDELEVAPKKDGRKTVLNSEDHLIEMIDTSDELEAKMKESCVEVWNRIESALKRTQRRGKYRKQENKDA